MRGADALEPPPPSQPRLCGASQHPRLLPPGPPPPACGPRTADAPPSPPPPPPRARARASSRQTRADYNADDVEHYFNYMGCLAVEGTYDRMEEMMGSGLDPVDVILLLAAAENDDPKIEELINAGADVTVKDNLGRRPAELATKEIVVKMLKDAEAKVAV
ncbi:MAG: hypothetical protein J3K34DRAFT_373050 [Monoraphidium minutum]|nr:MAG: hypothetical protein J3K34DRAFT_373050 [Monoraphidium minutum]